jgi:hypothetical protein
MIWKIVSIGVFAAVITITVACTKRTPATQLEVDIPRGFTGNFVLDMGVRDAPPLPRQGAAYIVTVPLNGKAQTSSILNSPSVTFNNGNDGQVWGLSERVFTTGDGIAIGGKIEFFVGTQKDFEAEQKKKNKSGGFFKAESVLAGA